MFTCTKAQLIYCTNCTVCKWSVLTVITQKLLLHVQLHNSTAHLLYKYCTNCTVCKWTVLTVITQKLLSNVQLHNSTAHLLYKLQSMQLNLTYIIPGYLLLLIQVHNCTAHLLYTLFNLQQQCIYSNYTETAAKYSVAQQHSTFTVQTLLSATELYLQ